MQGQQFTPRGGGCRVLHLTCDCFCLFISDVQAVFPKIKAFETHIGPACVSLGFYLKWLKEYFTSSSC